MAQMILGELVAAERNLRRSIELYRESENEFDEAIEHQELGRLLAYQGMFGEAEVELTQAQEFFDKNRPTNCISAVRAYRSLRSLLMGDPHAALKSARKARELADVQR